MNNTWNWKGARWWKFDFHSHTPASSDFGKGVALSSHQEISYKDWLISYMKQGVDCVAITDHNSGAGIDPLKKALSELRKEGNEFYRDIILFPGVELSVQGNIHILAIFGRDKTSSDIDSLIGAVKYRGTKGKSDGCSECSASEVIDEITKQGGLAIPAHVDQEKGLFTLAGATLEQVLENKNIIAMEVVDISKDKPQLYIDKKLTWSEVLGSDSHHLSGSCNQHYPGSHFTWVKMSKPCLEGLRLALIDGDLSLKRSDCNTEDPNDYAGICIENIQIQKAKYLGMNKIFSCELNPWLNSIIGGRGTGKSTILEFLRIALDRRDEIPQSIAKDFDKYEKISKSRQDEGLLKADTKIQVIARKDGSRFRITWNCAEDIHSIEEEKEGIWKPSQGSVALRFPVRLFSQKQIFELAKQPQGLLKVIDDAQEVRYREWEQQNRELTSKYLASRARERVIETQLHEESVVNGQLEDVKRKLLIFENNSHKEVLQCYRNKESQFNAINVWENSWRGSAEKIRTCARNILPLDLNRKCFDDNNAIDTEFLDVVSRYQALFYDIQMKMENLADRFEDALKSWDKELNNLSITKEIKKAKQRYSDLVAMLDEAGAGNPSEYAALVKYRQELEDKINEFKENRDCLEDARIKSEELFELLKNHRSEITELRSKFLKNILLDNDYVQIQIIPFGNTTTLEKEFRELIGKNGTEFEKDIGTIDSKDGIVGMLSHDSQEPIGVKIERVKSAIKEIYDTSKTEILKIKDSRFTSHIQRLKPEQLDRIRCWFPEDSVEVKFRLNGSKEFKSVREGSPGQKTAALLAFIFAYGHEPLVLDQPEDDLDNQLIYDLIVAQLRRIKQKRQILGNEIESKIISKIIDQEIRKYIKNIELFISYPSILQIISIKQLWEHSYNG